MRTFGWKNEQEPVAMSANRLSQVQRKRDQASALEQSSRHHSECGLTGAGELRPSAVHQPQRHTSARRHKRINRGHTTSFPKRKRQKGKWITNENINRSRKRAKSSQQPSCTKISQSNGEPTTPPPASSDEAPLELEFELDPTVTVLRCCDGRGPDSLWLLEAALLPIPPKQKLIIVNSPSP